MKTIGTCLALNANRNTGLRGEMIYRVFLGVIVLMLASKHSLGEPMKPVLVDIPIEKVFIPRGFDSNDRVQFAVGGELKNSCFKIASNEVSVNTQTKMITVKQKAYVYMGFCLMMIVPYSEVVTLGIVAEPGKYQIVDGGSGNNLGLIEVGPARISDQDEFIYAPVSDVNIERSSGLNTENDPKRNRVVLTGTFSNDCTRIEEVQVDPSENTIVIRPITAFDKPLNQCQSVKTNFSHTVVLDPNLRGDYLIHVRSLNGAAINRVVEFSD